MAKTPKQFQRSMRRRLRGVREATVEGIQEGALTAPMYLVQRLEDVGAVDTGALKAAAANCVEFTADGAELHIRSRYAAPIEYGTRPHFPPVEALRPWVRRKLGEVDDDGEGDAGIAFLVARKIAEDGTEPRYFVRDSLPDIMREIDAAIKDGLRGL